ncbi:MAG TPA: hypothetical protein VEH31_00265, partial [Streptosporangiaceae bacterium]|nr:hypothetical protein [Streptosporangiaceae bacterium]
TYAKFPMVRDLQESSDLLEESDVVAAIAGDQQAEEAIRAQGDGPAGTADGMRSPKREFLVLDADTSQSA